MLIGRLLERVVEKGTLTVIDASGRPHVIGGRLPGPRATIRLHDPRLETKLAFNPRLYVGEAYMDGTLTIEEGSLYDFIELIGVNVEAFEENRWVRTLAGLSRIFRRLQQFNPRGRAKANVAHHYDLSDRLYDLFLDRDRQYSCAYFQSDNESLEVAQLNKKRHLASKLLLKPGCRVLDIGSGWGGLALYIAETTDCEVVGITLSEEQHKVSNRRAAELGLADRVRFYLRDYRDETGIYDRIVSVGMFEHVGAAHYDEFFGRLKGMLKPDGVALLHSIGRMEPPGSTNAWLRKYIFPGGYTPALSEALAAVERLGLWVTDIEILRLHYAKTIREWRRRFEANREAIRALYDERFCRMWEFYLVGVELSFRYWRQMVFQMQLAREQTAVPLTRDYMLDWEREHIRAATAAQ